MTTGLLLQPELVIAWIKNDPNDPLLGRIKRFFNDHVDPVHPALSSVSYGIAHSSISNAANLSPQEAESLKSQLRDLQRNRTANGAFYTFDLDAAAEWANIRFHCKELSPQPSGEVQMEYAIARAHQLGVLAPNEETSKYPNLRTLVLRFL